MSRSHSASTIVLAAALLLAGFLGGMTAARGQADNLLSFIPIIRREQEKGGPIIPTAGPEVTSTPIPTPTIPSEWADVRQPEPWQPFYLVGEGLELDAYIAPDYIDTGGRVSARLVKNEVNEVEYHATIVQWPRDERFNAGCFIDGPLTLPAATRSWKWGTGWTFNWSHLYGEKSLIGGLLDLATLARELGLSYTSGCEGMKLSMTIEVGSGELRGGMPDGSRLFVWNLVGARPPVQTTTPPTEP